MRGRIGSPRQQEGAYRLTKTPPSRTQIPIGILYSVTGSYGPINRSMANAAIMGLEEADRENGAGATLVPMFLDCGGRLGAYTANCERLIFEHGCRHVIGCYTSAARKQLLPLLERTNTLLWHSPRYEGFEASENVIYVGAAPNQHLLPLARFMLSTGAPDVYCVGTNYVWTWESNRVLRDVITRGGGRIVAQRLLGMGDLRVDHLIAEIRRMRPTAIFNTLVGAPSYRFHQKLWRAVAADADGYRPTIFSCSLCEEELPLIGEPASIGHIASATYFRSIDREENRRFLRSYAARFGDGSGPSVDAEAAYICARLLGRAVTAAGTDTVDLVRRAAQGMRFEAPQGPVWVDPATNHCHVTPRLAVSGPKHAFRILWQAPEPVAPDPFLALQEDGHPWPAAWDEGWRTRLAPTPDGAR